MMEVWPASTPLGKNAVEEFSMVKDDTTKEKELGRFAEALGLTMWWAMKT